MLLEWTQHSLQLVDGISRVLQAKGLLDVTISAEGRQIKVHRLVLAAASSYFSDLLLTSDDDRSPIIFLRDVPFSDVESLIQFIYTGRTDVPGDRLSSFLDLAKTLGVSGFTSFTSSTDASQAEASPAKTPTKRKMEEDDDDKENFQPLNVISPPPSFTQTPTKKFASEPAILSDLGSSQKRRRLTQSLDDIDHPHHHRQLSGFESPLPASPRWLEVPVVFRAPPPYPGSSRQAQVSHVPSSSCPVPRQEPQQPPKTQSNLSYDAAGQMPMLDPDELAAKGATLLHHLALWMIQERQYDNVKEPIKQSDEVVERPTSTLPATFKRPAAHPLRSVSECDRPDSGFDSKDDGRSTPRSRGEDSASSPEGVVITRQAPNRQPVFRKRRQGGLNLTREET